MQKPKQSGKFREENPNWRGGRSKTEHGYILVRVGVDHPLADVRGYAYEHRLRAFQAGQDIEGKVVHHINGDRTCNEVANLEALTQREHLFKHRSPESKRRLPDEPNFTVECECGCGTEFDYYDSLGRPRRHLPGHNTRHSPRNYTEIKILEVLESGSFSRSEIAERADRTRQATAVCLSKLKKKGLVCRVSHGKWGKT